MKKMMALLLTLVLVAGLLAVPVSAEAAKGESDTVEDAVITIGAVGEEYVGEVALEEFAEDMEDTLNGVQDALDGVQDAVEGVQETVEEVSGLVAWLMELLEKILDFFGL